MAGKIKLTFLGTSDAIPTAKRNHTSVLISYDGENILFDCGEGTQRQFRKAKLNLCKVNKILITHWHGDHVLGIPGLLQTLALSGYQKDLTIYGPRGTKKFMNKLLETFVFVQKFQINIVEIKKEGKFFETPDFYLESKKMTHGTPCNAYSFTEKSKIKIDKSKLKKTNLPSGSLLQNLKKGKDIVYNGKKYLAKNLTFKEKDKKVSFITDTNVNKNTISLSKNSDLLICESNFDAGMKKRAKEYHHLTSEQAANIAKKSKSKKLVLTHISHRYENNLKVILDDAKKVFKNVSVAKDLDSFEV